MRLELRRANNSISLALVRKAKPRRPCPVTESNQALEHALKYLLAHEHSTIPDWALVVRPDGTAMWRTQDTSSYAFSIYNQRLMVTEAFTISWEDAHAATQTKTGFKRTVTDIRDRIIHRVQRAERQWQQEQKQSPRTLLDE